MFLSPAYVNGLAGMWKAFWHPLEIDPRQIRRAALAAVLLAALGPMTPDMINGEEYA